ncbi:MAG: nucleoside triphosphate pyrophosphohydrolase [Gemmatimonadota bacterium]
MNQKQSDALERVMDLVRYLRAHCPWDGAQTPRSLIPYLLEEAHEAADAIAHGDDDALRAELGDLLLNVAFQLVLGEERDAFDADGVADAVIAKMERRHPHLFGGDQEPEDWETLKARERDHDTGLLHGVAPGLDPLSRAHRIQDRVAGIGFDWENARGAFEKVAEELEEVREVLFAADGEQRSAPAESGHTEVEGAVESAGALEEELGDLLFAVVNLTRLAGAHALTALHGANAKFSRRFEALERLAARRDVDLEAAELDELEALWTEVKAAENDDSAS